MGVDAYYNFGTADPVISESIEVTFGVFNRNAPYSYIFQSNIKNADGTLNIFYSTLQSGPIANYGQALAAVWNSNAANLILGPGSTGNNFNTEGSGATIKHTLDITSGSSWILTDTLSNGELTISVTNVATGVTTIVGSQTGIPLTSTLPNNFVIGAPENYGPSSLSDWQKLANTNVTFSNTMINGKPVAMTYSGELNPSPSTPSDSLYVLGNNYFQAASGGVNQNDVQLACASATIVSQSSTGVSNILHVTPQFHDLTHDSVIGSLALDLAGQKVNLTAAQSGDLTSVIDNIGNGSISIVDNAVNFMNNINSIAKYSSDLASITLTDVGIPTLAVTATQRNADSAVFSAIASNFSVIQTATGGSQVISGIPNALGNTVVFPGRADQYTVTPSGDGLHFTVSTSGSSDQLSDIQALQFSDITEIVAPTPGMGGTKTGGNITELYGAVFGRVPDVAGLNYYEKELAANPTLPLTALAQNFLQSPEYKNNIAHSYAQTTAGDTQFITDLYQNLLHRAPAPGDAAWYEANVIAPILGNATSGSPAYALALLQAHAAVVTDFSAAAEFLSDVQVTAVHRADATHWLVLI